MPHPCGNVKLYLLRASPCLSKKRLRFPLQVCRGKFAFDREPVEVLRQFARSALLAAFFAKAPFARSFAVFPVLTFGIFKTSCLIE
jgi:hypothetical protein